MMHEQGSAISLIQFVRFRTEGARDRVELLEAASRKLAEAMLLLVKAANSTWLPVRGNWQRLSSFEQALHPPWAD
jgi:hypothetical protein